MTNNELEKMNVDFRQSLRAAANLQAELTAARQILTDLSERSARERAELTQAIQDIAALKRMMLEQKRMMQDQKRMMVEQERMLLEKTKKLLAAEQNTAKVVKENNDLKAKIATIYRSTSWRITGPLRSLSYLSKRKVR